MLDPFTTAATCTSLINGITSLAFNITGFVNDVRGARKDMDLISRELTSLSLCLEALRTDCRSERVEYPEAFRKAIEQSLLNIDVLTQQVKELLNKLASGKLGRRIQWSMQNKDSVDRLRSSLETQKSTIGVALQCGSIQILCAIQKQVERPAQDLQHLTDTTHAIRQDAKILRKEAVDIKQLIREEANALRDEISALQQGMSTPRDIQEFLKFSQEYSNQVTNPFVSREDSNAPPAHSRTRSPSISSLASTTETLVIKEEPSQTLGGRQPGSVLSCPDCGCRITIENFSAPAPQTGVLPGISDTTLSPRDTASHEADGDMLEMQFFDVTVKCGHLSFRKQFLPTDKFEVRAIATWFHDQIELEAVNRRFYVPDITGPESIALSFRSLELIAYPGETFSDVAPAYGFGNVVELIAAGTPLAIPDFRSHILFNAHYELVAPSRDTVCYQIDFTLKNGNDRRWHAPIAWLCTLYGEWRFESGSDFGATASSHKRSSDSSRGTSFAGGVLEPGASIPIRLSSHAPQKDAILALKAILLKPEHDKAHWKRLVQVAPETACWTYSLTALEVNANHTCYLPAAFFC